MLERPPAVRLLCEREVLERTDWPSREYLNARIRSDGFPKPRKRLRGLGDQWLESEVLLWIDPEAELGPQTLVRKFKAAG